MTKFATLKERLLQNPEVRAEYDALEAEFALASAVIAARSQAHLTQEQVADRMQTKQTAVARLESGRSLPSMRTLQRFAEATGTRLRISFEPVQTQPAPHP